MYSINHLSRRARRAGISTLLASFTAFSLLSGAVPTASAQSGGLSVSINDVAVTEGTDAAAVFTVTVSGKHPNQGITVDYTTLDDSAVAGLDYDFRADTLSIPASDASNDGLTGTISVPLIDDATHEPKETFKVKLLASSVNISDNIGIATITSNDPKAKLRIRDAQASEDSGSMVFNVELDRPSNVDVTVDYATVDDTSGNVATAGQDYVSKSDTLTFPADTNPTKQIVVPITDDKVYEGNEHFLVKLSNSFNATIARDTATGTIEEDELKPVLAMTSTGFAVKEGNSDNVVGVDVGLSGLADKDVTFSFATADGATPAAHGQGTNADYTPTSGTGTIRAGSLLTFIPVTINGDKTPEQNESFIVTISDQSSNARLGGALTTVTLTNDD